MYVWTAGGTALGALLLVAASSAVGASADDDRVDNGQVGVSVVVTDRYPSGVLAMSVAADQTALTEVDTGDPLVREFKGTLPTVTVTDTRSTVPAIPWYVLGTASDFASGADRITADHFGWSPELAADYGDTIAPGGDVRSVVDDADSEGLGYVDGELLYVNSDQLESYHAGSWSATAKLDLKVPAADVRAGHYTSVLTLSLFE